MKAEMGRVREEKRREEKWSEVKRREEKRRRKRKSQKEEDPGARKGRKVAKHCVFQWFEAPEGRDEKFSTLHVWKKSRRIASFLMFSTSKNEEVSQNCFVFDVVKFKHLGSLAEMLRFWRCQIQKLRKSCRIAAFSSLQVDRQTDRQADKQVDR